MTKQFFRNKKVLVMGLGLHGGGVGVAKFFCGQGARVSVTDLKTQEQLAESIEKLKGLEIQYSLGGHKEADFISADLIIRNPDVPASSPYLEIARKNNVPVETDISLFFKLSKAFMIGVTGTKGKSTTASLIHHILKQKYKKVFLAGNIGVSPLELLAQVKKGDRVVLELSSFELEGLNQSPNIAVMTNIMPDHLNRYVTMEEYINAKKIIFKYQSKKDILVVNGDDPALMKFAGNAPSKVVVFSLERMPRSINLAGFKLLGEHNLSNLLAAIEVAKLLKIPDKAIEKSLGSFNGVPSRQEFIRETNGVKYFNDTTATMPEAAIMAVRTYLESFPDSRLILICGGMNKGLQYTELSKLIKERVDEVILLPGTGSDKIETGLSNYERINKVSSMQAAVKKAKELSQPGDIVVLSPAAASFNLFKNEFDRGRQFVEVVKNLK